MRDRACDAGVIPEVVAPRGRMRDDRDMDHLIAVTMDRPDAGPATEVDRRAAAGPRVAQLARPAP